MRCDSCQMIAINGVPCHEIGCPNGRSAACRECGTKFRGRDARAEAAGCCQEISEGD